VGFLFPVSPCFYLILSVDVILASEVLAYTGILGLSGVSRAGKLLYLLRALAFPPSAPANLWRCFTIRFLLSYALHLLSRGTDSRRLWHKIPEVLLPISEAASNLRFFVRLRFSSDFGHQANSSL
jgi:hypothetical protein